MTQLGAFGDPVPMVVSGVNPGPVAAAQRFTAELSGSTTAANNGAHQDAVSLDVTDAPMQWETAIHLVPEMVERLRLIEKGAELSISTPQTFR